MSVEKRWKEIAGRPEKYGRPDNRIRTKEEQRIEQSLSREVSIHVDKEPLSEVIQHLKSIAGVNIVLDEAGLVDAGHSSDTLVTLNVDNIQLKSALNLLLWIAERRAVVCGDTLVDFGGGFGLNDWLKGGVTHDEIRRRLRPLLELPIELVLPTHGEPTDPAALQSALV